MCMITLMITKHSSHNSIFNIFLVYNTMMIVISCYFPTAELKGDNHGGDTERATKCKSYCALEQHCMHSCSLIYIGNREVCRSVSIELYTTII